ncbi:MAG: prepilin peptidase [Nanoarchaeota archaeon]
MEEYYFLFFVAFLYVIFASVQDLRKREVADWLTFSLIVFALAYRAFYSAVEDKYNFFVLGLAGFAFFFVLAHLFYYGKVFAGGDAKLLMGFGAILPLESFGDILINSMVFILILFSSGLIYSLAYSFFIISENKNFFPRAFSKEIREKKYMLYGSVLLFVFFFSAIIFYNFPVFSIIFSVVPLLYIYLRAFEKSCMIKIVPANRVGIGDWLEKDIVISGRKIRKSVHGLSKEDVKAIRKSGKRVMIKYGVPFVPAFLITHIVMVSFYLFLKNDLRAIFYFLF